MRVQECENIKKMYTFQHEKEESNDGKMSLITKISKQYKET